MPKRKKEANIRLRLADNADLAPGSNAADIARSRVTSYLQDAKQKGKSCSPPNSVEVDG